MKLKKATEHHLGLLRAKLMRLRAELAEKNSKKTEKGQGFAVPKSGLARVSMIGFPSVGKSTLLNKSTSAFSKAASYEFTTLTCIPGFLDVIFFLCFFISKTRSFCNLIY